MNATNRAANRVLLVLVGLVVAAAGATAIAIGTVPTFAAGWRTWFAADHLQAWATRPVVGTAGWAAIGAGALALVVALLLIAFITRQGRGHAVAVLERRASTGARTRIDLAIPRTLLAERLADEPEVLASRITAYAVRGTPTLKISVRARRGASPTRVADVVVTALRALDLVLGQEIPAFVQVSGGFRARSSARARVA